MACRYSLFALHSSKNLLKATVLDDIWPEILFFTSVAAVVCVVTDYTHYDLGISNVLLVVLGNIIILQTILSFRTASASERYNEARSLWGSLCTTSKNLAQAIWIHIPNARTTENGEQDEIRGIIEKKSIINVIQALVVSAKHFVRDEKGVDYVDLWPLICWLPTFQITPDHPYWYKLDFGTSSSTFVGDSQSPPHLSSRAPYKPTSGHHYYRQSSGDESATDVESDEAELLHNPCSPTARSIYSRILPYVPNYDKLKPAANPPKERLRDVFPLWRFIAFLGRRIRGVVDGDPVRADGLDPRDRRKRNPYVSVECSVPWQVWLVLSSYLAYLNENKLMPDRAIEKVITETIIALQDIISQLERLTNTPLPFAYQVHIRMCTWLYLFFLPFQLFDQFKYITIPIVALFTFIFVGFMEIGEEIENPFDYDPNDLNLDQFCLRLQRELHEITAVSMTSLQKKQDSQ
ncbi:hypothetical protein AN958_06406 [Leucoagaricus sp. SymC.cos]|nr:hypothetical protein AN958_06406 [Leucoagaricus sp. SymC.cos]